MENKAHRKLTPKQDMFCREYLVDLNATQAAIRAGYSAKTAEWQGPQLLRKTHVAAKIQELKDKRADRIEVTADYVLKTIIDTVERCKQAEPVLDRKGEPVMVADENGELRPIYKFDSQAVLKGAELLGKHLALFTDKQEITGKGGKALIPENKEIDLSKLSDSALEELRKIADDADDE